MQYITSVERSGIQKGIEQGLLQKAREDVIEVLRTRFELVPQALVKVINEIDNSSTLNSLLKQAVTIESLEEFWSTVEAEKHVGQTATPGSK